MKAVDLNGVGMTSMRTRERLVQRLRDEGISDEIVLNVIRTTPRHIFVDEALSHRAYEDTALPIGFNQTLSQPYTVARMTELLLQAGAPRKVLEVGSGSGYQTAVLAQLVNEVYTVERIGPLQEKAKSRMKLLELSNVAFLHTDGGMGWPEKGPFDAIMVTAAPDTIPEALIEQLAIGGRMVIPVGGDKQYLTLVDRTSSGVEIERVEPARFVPLLAGIR
ncbi:protein-L-isoaspartate O-methyltransferase [Litoribrevibacter albus]|uniref:Protein-L-isoaspartate O-methyltransferase n=2 Tax=Litoribrevibacter albus TaxID=1473156 RepID=A0AA37W7B3_9GAMM|nr:protein-L-isoaspartate O-methyltransferase [Litoribrevibacter albus]